MGEHRVRGLLWGPLTAAVHSKPTRPAEREGFRFTLIWSEVELTLAGVTYAAKGRSRHAHRRHGFGRAVLACSLLCCAVLVLVWLDTTHAADGFTVLRVYDGDTILVAGDSGHLTVRLVGIDAPETSKGKGEPGQPYSRIAQRYLAKLVLKQTVALEEYGKDRYGRILAVVYSGEHDINCAMLQAGLAEVYRGRTPENFDKSPYRKAEAEARQMQTGMWRQGEGYVSPIRWKHPR